jgi:hypothetical protein
MRMKMNVVPALPVLQFRSWRVARLAILARSPQATIPCGAMLFVLLECVQLCMASA